MNILTDDVYDKVVILAKKVKENLRKQGIVVPIDNPNGTVQIGTFLISKTQNGEFSISDHHGDMIVDNINLPQTAAIIANDLALGRFLNQELLKEDRNYGFALFEENLYQQIIGKKSRANKLSLDRYDLIQTKCLISKSKRERHKQSIIRRFEKLRRLV